MIFFFFSCVLFTTFVICFILLTHVSETIELDLVNLSSNESSSTVVKTTPIINLNSSSMVSNNSGGGSPNLTNLTHLSQPTKKESNLRSWFHLSSSSNTAAGTNQSGLNQVPNSSLDISTTSTYQQQDLNSTMLTDNNGTSDANASPQPSMQSSKSSKTNFGEIFNNKQNKFKEQRPTSPPLQQSSTPIMMMTNTGGSETPSITIGAKTNAIAEQNSKEQQPQKSSRRTTSLLNLFMSNSQGNSHNLSLFKTFNMIFLMDNFFQYHLDIVNDYDYLSSYFIE